jgi:hypothetical protein
MSQQYFNEAKAATDTAQYSEAMNKAIVQLAQRKQERYNQQIDEEGNPSFDRMHDDIVNIGNNISSDISGTLRSPTVAAKFKESFGGLMANTQVEALSQARKQQEDYVNSQADASFKTLGNYASTGSIIDAVGGTQEYSRQLDSLVANGAMTFAVAEKRKEAFNQWVSENRTRRMIQSDPTVMSEALSPNSDGEVLKANAISLNEDKRNQLHEEAVRANEHQLRLRQATESARIDSIKDLYSETDKLIERGGVPDPQVIATMKNAAEGTPFSQKIAELQDKASRVTLFSGLSSIERNAVLTSMRSKGELTSDYELYSRIDGKLQEAQNKDIYSFAISQNLVPAPAPLDVNGDIRGQLAQRRGTLAVIQSHYGQKAVGVTSDELDALVSKANSLPPSDKAKFFGDIVGGLGSKSIDLFSKMAKNGNRSDALIGSLVLDGRQDLASKILAGKQFMQEGTLKLGPVFDKNSALEASDTLPPTSNPAFEADIVDMAKAVYAQKTAVAKDFTQVFNSDRWKNSLQEVMGGETIKVSTKDAGWFDSGSKIVPPVKDMDAKGFQSWLGTVSDSNINAAGGWAGWTSGMSDQLQKAKFEQAGLGKYLVLLPSKMSSTGYSPVQDSKGQMFILDYDMIRDLQSGAPSTMISAPAQAPTRISDLLDKLTFKPALTSVTPDLEGHIQAAAQQHGVDPKLLRAVIQQESKGNINAVSSKGAVGPMQLMPGTAKELGVQNINDPASNIDGGAKYLSQLLSKYQGNIPKALAAYNAGPGAVDKAGGVPNFKETRQYVRNIVNNLAKQK